MGCEREESDRYLFATRKSIISLPNAADTRRVFVSAEYKPGTGPVARLALEPIWSLAAAFPRKSTQEPQAYSVQAQILSIREGTAAVTALPVADVALVMGMLVSKALCVIF